MKDHGRVELVEALQYQYVYGTASAQPQVDLSVSRGAKL